MAVSCFLLLNIHLNFFPCPGVNDKHNVGHFVLTIPCSFTVVYPRCKLCFLYLNIRLSCERYRKNIVKNTVLSGYQVNLPYRGTLPSHSALTQQLLSQLHKAIYIQGLLFIHFDCDISRPCVLYPFCVLHPKPITYTVQIWFVWIPRCDFYSRVQICGG